MATLKLVIIKETGQIISAFYKKKPYPVNMLEEPFGAAAPLIKSTAETLEIYERRFSTGTHMSTSERESSTCHYIKGCKKDANVLLSSRETKDGSRLIIDLWGKRTSSNTSPRLTIELKLKASQDTTARLAKMRKMHIKVKTSKVFDIDKISIGNQRLRLNKLKTTVRKALFEMVSSTKPYRIKFYKGLNYFTITKSGHQNYQVTHYKNTEVTTKYMIAIPLNVTTERLMSIVINEATTLRQTREPDDIIF